ncbi:hypothetical protein [uncultured Hymenobacter sp.]|uniref:hypothetical protein n=1 Tax=uncultured Hymenobacter sp. TaxID=170016 RepID=UPI0035CB60B0
MSLEFQNDYQCLAEPSTHHLTFDLRTGRLLTLADLVADPPAQLSRGLCAAISRRLRDDLATVAANYGDSAQVAYVAALYGIQEWAGARYCQWRKG